MTKKQNKHQYLTPKVSVVAFKVEGGFGDSDVKTPKPVAGGEGALYSETQDRYFTSDFSSSFNN